MHSAKLGRPCNIYLTILDLFSTGLRMVKVISNFSRLTDGELSNLSDSVFSKMSGNAHFPNPNPPLASLSAAGVAFSDATAAAAGGGVAETAAKNAARDTLEATLTALAKFVQNTANLTVEMVLSSGFSVAKTPQRATTPPDAPTNLQYEQGAGQGIVDVSLDAVNADWYEGEQTTDPNNAASWVPTTPVAFKNSRRISVTNLTPGTGYWLRFRGVKNNMRGPWSD